MIQPKTKKFRQDPTPKQFTALELLYDFVTKYIGFGGGAGGLPSFDGGGYTGAGSRSGGVDNKGGFPALLHPGETVIDHTKGGGAAGGGSTNISIKIDVSGARGNAEIEEMVQRGVRGGMAQIKNQVPKIMAENQRRRN